MIFNRKTTTLLALATVASAAFAGPSKLGERNPLTPPFIHVFDNYTEGMEREDFAQHFQTIDANNDERCWGYYNYSDSIYSKCAYLLPPLTEDPACDDWLITEAFTLEKGKYYRMSVDASMYDGNGKAMFEAWCGVYNDAEGLNTKVIPATEVTGIERTFHDGWFKAKFNGIHYLGIRAIQATKFTYLFIDNIAVAGAVEGTAPSTIENLAMENDYNGSTTVSMSFTAPAVDMDGNPLTANLTIDLTANGTLIKRFSNVKPGKELTITHTPVKRGWVDYEFTPSNASGTGKPLKQRHYAGIATPKPPVITSFVELENGQVRITWDAPATDIMGTAINPDLVRYTVYDATDVDAIETLVTGHGETSYTFTPWCPSGGQTLVLAIVTAEFSGDVSEYAPTEFLTIGKPYGLPYIQSFGPRETERLATVGTLDPNVTWRWLDDFSDPNSQDGDNGYVAMVGNAPGQNCELQTGKIDLGPATAPALSLYTYVYEDDENTLDIVVYDNATNERTVAYTVNMKDFDRNGWQRVYIALPQFAGKVVRLGLDGHIKTHGYIPVDNIRLDQMADIDLTANAISAPRFAEVGVPYEVSVTVTNSGALRAAGATVVLVRNDEEVATAAVPELASMEMATVTISDTFNPLTVDNPSVYARVDMPGETNLYDNVTATVTLSCLGNNHPVPAALEVTDNSGSVTLSWQAPDLSNIAPDQVVEDFEGYNHLATDLAPFATADRDEGFNGGFIDLPMSGIDGTVQSWFVLDCHSPFDFIDTPSGSKAAVQMYARSEDGRYAVQCDDWLITPELYGGRQTVSFMAASLTVEYGSDTYECYYSTGSTNPADFILLTPETETGEMWERYYVTLPEGARRMAIRCTSYDTYMMMVDDLAYTPVGTPGKLTLTGYNVYHNQELLGFVPAGTTTFSAVRTSVRDIYSVTAVYDKGESMAVSKTLDDNASITAIELAGNEAEARYYTTSGIEIDRPQLPGVYLRRCGNHTSKVVIR